MATTTPTFSSNYDAEQGQKDLTPLLKTEGGKWNLIASGKGVERSFKFKTFKKTWVCLSPALIFIHSRNFIFALIFMCLEPMGFLVYKKKKNKYDRAIMNPKLKEQQEFMNTVASECAVKKHHPEWSNVCPSHSPLFHLPYLPTCCSPSPSQPPPSQANSRTGIQHNLHPLDDALSSRTIRERHHHGEIL